jgi:hypothetical protein
MYTTYGWKRYQGLFTTTGRILFYNSRTEFADALFRNSSMANSIQLPQKCLVLPLLFGTGPSKLFEFQEIVDLFHPCVDVYICIYMYIYIRIYIHAYIYIYIYIHIYIYITHTHTHTHTHLYIYAYVYIYMAV